MGLNKRVESKTMKRKTEGKPEREIKGVEARRASVFKNSCSEPRK